MSIQSAHRSNDENTRPHSGAASSREADLGSAPIGSLLFKLALPAIAAQIINVLYNMVDRMYIGISRVPALALAGVGVCGPIVTLLSSFGTLVGLGGSILLGIRMGEGNLPKARQILSNSFFDAVRIFRYTDNRLSFL